MTLSPPPLLFTLTILTTLLSPTISFTPNPNDADSLPFPVIGLFTQPSPYSSAGFPSSEYSYIPASYVKHLESAGAVVVPIQWDLPTSQIDTLLSKINGILFPGGGSLLVNKASKTPTKLLQSGMHIIDKAIEFNNNGDYFPVWGTCLGYELLMLSMSNNMTLLVNVSDGDDIAKVLDITPEGLDGIYADMDPDLTHDVGTMNLSYFHHKHTPDPLSFTNDDNIASNFTVAAWTVDSLAGEYAAIIQGKVLPFMGTQFHPEKNTYEWDSTTLIPHVLQAVQSQQYYAYYFANETLKSKHRFNSEADLEGSLIYNYKAEHLGPNPEFEQLYFFKNYMTYSVDNDMIEEYPKGYGPPREVRKSVLDTLEAEDAVKFKESAPFLFVK